MRLTAGLVGLVTTMSVGAAVLVGAGSSGADRSEPVPAGADRIIGSQKGVVAQNAEFAATVHRFPATQDLDGRAAPRLDARTLKVNAYRKGAAVPVVCQLKSETAYGSNIWDKTSDGYYVTDRYVKTGVTGFAPGVPRCAATSGAVRKFPAIADLNGRAAPRLDAKVLKVNAYRKGGSVPVVCQTTGGPAYGSTIWDKTSDGYCVADAYVRTGYSGLVPGLAKCTGVPPTHPPTGRTVKGIDISSNQGANFDLRREYAAGIRFVYIKATEGSSYVSSTFSKQNTGAIAAGILHGAYHFANPAGASGAAQARYFLSHGGGWKADGHTLPGVLDMSSTRTGTARTPATESVGPQ